MWAQMSDAVLGLCVFSVWSFMFFFSFSFLSKRAKNKIVPTIFQKIKFKVHFLMEVEVEES